MNEQVTRILLVEDDKAHAELVCRAFEAHRRPFHVTIADSLAEAQAALTEARPHLIIADLRLPDGLGTDLLPAEEEKRTIPLVVMTAQGDEAAAVQSIKAGALDYQVKSEAILAVMPHIAESALREWRHITERKETEVLIQETARLASIGELAAGVAHEINNPLTSVLGYSAMMLRSSIPGEFRKDIQTIFNEAERAAKIVRNLLFFAKQRDTEKQYLNLNSVLNRSLEMKAYDFKVGNIEVVSQLSPEIRKSMIDEHQMGQVFLNILANAEHAIHNVSGQGQIEVCTAISGDEIVITIKDDGPGMPSETLHRIFEPFFTTKEVGQGTGLGLSISYGIIKQHGGDIWAESVQGEGTTFHITLPVVVPEEIGVFQAPTSAATDSTTKHLLVVDDEPHIRDLLRKYLELERYTVDLAEDGQEALRKLANMEYDCILLDLKMPGMSGPKLYQLMQGTSEALASKVVFITGDTVSSDTRSFISKARNPVVTKPFRLEELLRTVRGVWDGLPVAT